MKNPRKEVQYIADESGRSSIEKVKAGLTSTKENILEKTMHRHDKAFKRLAKM